MTLEDCFNEFKMFFETIHKKQYNKENVQLGIFKNFYI